MTIHALPTSKPEPDPEIILALESLLKRARAGEILGLLLVWKESEICDSTAVCNSDELAAHAYRAAHGVLMDTDEDDA